MNDLPRDLFGRPIFGGLPKPKQPPLFDSPHWFELGYLDKWRGNHRDRMAPEAYQRGYEAAGRDMTQDDRDSNCNPGRAYDQAAAVGIIERS